MKRHSIIVRLGLDDTKSVDIINKDSQITQLQLISGNRNLDYGLGDLIRQTTSKGIIPNETGLDLLLLASIVYCADTRINRYSNSQDNWTREIDIYLPVYQPLVWEKLSPLLKKSLEFLTGDKWRFIFRQRPNGFNEIIVKQINFNTEKPSSICLFSGGLDSFIGAIDLLENRHTPLLISHSWVTLVSHYQDICFRKLQRQFGVTKIKQIKARIGFHNNTILHTTSENTERSRSFLFFAIAGFVASGLKNTPIFVPENGLISLNIPLDPLRLGSLSTRTTHPFFMSRFNDILKQLEIDSYLFNPYRHKTKGEMVQECLNQSFLAKNIINTMSCSSPAKARWLKSEPKHCGFCVPCIIRRASLNNWSQNDPTDYLLSDLHQRPLSSTNAEGDNIRSFQLAISRLDNNINRAKVLIHKSGPLTDFTNEIDDFARVYLKGMQEVSELLNGVKTIPNE